MKTFTIGENATKITYKIEQIGQDIDITITGGVEHIGCAALISNRSYNIIKVANHREDDIIMPLARQLVKKDTPTILIKAGFHIDNITIDEIKEVTENNNKAIKIIEDYITSIDNYT